MSAKALVVFALIAASSLSQARVTDPATIKAYEVGMAETRASIVRAGSEAELAKVLEKYQSTVFRKCGSISLFIQNAKTGVVSVFNAARNFSWGVIAGNEVIRHKYGIEGSRVEAAAQLGQDTVIGAFEELNDNIHGQFGSCTMALDQVKLVQNAIAERGANVGTVVKQPNGEDTPFIIIHPGSNKH